jgi:hypothetical protein
MPTAIPEAPNFQAYLHRVEGRPVLRMLRSDWRALLGQEGQPVAIDVRQTPMARVASQGVVAIAEAHSSGVSRIEIYRTDSKDAPTPINMDSYLVLEDPVGRWDLLAIGNAASTEDNQNLRDYLRSYVFLVKEAPGVDHWLPALPDKVLSVVRRTPPEIYTRAHRVAAETPANRPKGMSAGSSLGSISSTGTSSIRTRTAPTATRSGRI